MMKKILLFLFALAGSVFFSCSFLDSESEKCDEAKLQKSYEFSGSVKTPAAKSSSNLVSSKSSQSARTIMRTIMPEFPTSNLAFSVYYKKSGSDTKLEPKSLDTSTGDYSVAISEDGGYVFYAEVSDSSGKLLYSGETDSLTISDGKITVDGTETETIPAIQAKPLKSGSGNAEISVDLTGATQIGYVKAEWKLDSASSATTFTKEISSDSDRSFTLYLSDSSNTETSITSGTYTFSLYFYNNSTDLMELYRITNEVVQVYGNFTSNVYAGSAPYFSSDGKITITSSLISGTAYVAGTSPSKISVNSNGANGTYYAPFSLISDALAKVKASGSEAMTIYLDGTFDRSSDGVLELSVDSGKTLNINGLNGADSSIITGSSSYGISVASGSAVNLIDISVTKCAGGILNNGTLSLSGVLINGNTSSENGGGVCNNSSLSVSGGTKISGNKAGSGGGVYMATDASLSLGGNVEISGNSKSSDETKADNLSLGTQAITVSSELSGSIGISLQTALSLGGTQTLTSGFATYNSGTDADSVFSSDDSETYTISKTSGNEVLISKSSVVWISPDGSDTNTGTYDSPLATFSAAYKLFSDAGTLSSSTNVIKIKDTLTPTEGLNSNGYAITVTIEGAAGTSKSEKATIDLAKITYTHDNTTENARGFYVSAAQNLTFKNLTFTTSGTEAYLYGAVSVDNSSANVVIENCDFTDLNAKGACSAIALNSGNLTLKNVEITGNKATVASDGSRTYAVGFEGGTLTLSGKVTVSGNTESDGTTAGNVYIASGKTFALASDFSSESKIYFSAEDKPATSAVTFATGYSLSATPSGIFTDDDGYLVAKDSSTSTNLVIKTSGSGSVVISKPDLTFSKSLSDSTYTITATSNGTDVTTSVTGWNVYVAAGGVDIKDAAGFKVTATEGSSPTVGLPDSLASGTYTIEVSGTYGGTVYSGSIEFTKD